MSLQITKTTETLQKPVFVEVLEVKAGGAVVKGSVLGGEKVYPGTPILLNNSEYVVHKTVLLADDVADDANEIPVDKNHHFKVGDSCYPYGSSAAAVQTITAIDKDSSDEYDTITIGTTFGVALTEDDILYQASSVSDSEGVIPGTPYGYALTGFDVEEGGNHTDSIVVRGTLTEANAPPIVPHFISELPLIRIE